MPLKLGNVLRYGVLIVQKRKLYVTIQIVERRAFGFIIHALTIAVEEDSNCESLTINLMQLGGNDYSHNM